MASSETNEQQDAMRCARVVAIITWCMMCIGILAAILGFARIMGKHEYIEGGVCLIASVLSFGMLLNALLRK